jgi:hypothetical protein
MGFFRFLTTWVCTTVDLGSICTRYTQQIPLSNIPSIPTLHATHAPALSLPNSQKDRFCNTPYNRQCWIVGGDENFGIHTDYEQKWPKGVLREVPPLFLTPLVLGIGVPWLM